MMNKLKNCPMCNKQPNLEKFPVPVEVCYSGYLWTVVSGCGLELQGYGDKNATINKWNTRAADTSKDKLIAALTEIVACFSAAYTEGMHDELMEANNPEPGELADLVTRRLLPVLEIAEAALKEAERE